MNRITPGTLRICRISCLAICLVTLAACAQKRESDIAELNGGDGEGIGGTGIHDGEGIGGTGIHDGEGIGGTGIIGIISDVENFTVNGQNIRIDERTTVEIDGRLGSQSDLRRGQMVLVEASGATSSLRAERISIRYEIVGPITRTDPDADVVFVLDQRVSIAAGAHDPRPLNVGDWVAVSGLRLSDGRVEGTRIERRDAPSFAQLYGRYRLDPQDRGQPVRVANMRVKGLPSEQALVGRDVLLKGQFADGKFVASKIIPQSETPFESRPANISVAAYVDQQSDRLQLFGLSLVGIADTSNNDDAKDENAGRVVVMEGRLGQEAGKFEVLQVQELKDPLEKTPKGEGEAEPEANDPPEDKGAAAGKNPSYSSTRSSITQQQRNTAKPQTLGKQTKTKTDKQAEKDRKEREKEEKERQKQAEKDKKDRKKQAEKDRKEREKEEKERQKQAEKDKKDREKQAEKDRKEREKEEKERQKQAEKDKKDRDKKGKKDKKGNKKK